MEHPQTTDAVLLPKNCKIRKEIKFIIEIPRAELAAMVAGTETVKQAMKRVGLHSYVSMDVRMLTDSTVQFTYINSNNDTGLNNG